MGGLYRPRLAASKDLGNAALADALTDFRVIRDTREGVVVGRERNVRPDPAVGR